MSRWLLAGVYAGVIVLGAFAGASLQRSNTQLGVMLNETFDTLDALNAATADGGVALNEYPGLLVLGAKPLGPEDIVNPPVRNLVVGLNAYLPQQAQQGYTLYSPFYFGNKFRLVNMRGQTAHEWSLPRAAYIAKRQDNFVLGTTAMPVVSDLHVYPNGDLLLAYSHGQLRQPWGFGLSRIDKDSRPVWTYLKQVHHGFDIAPDGRIITLVHTMRDTPRAGLEWVATPFQDDFIAVLSPEGEELMMVSVLEAIQNSDWSSLLMYANPDAKKGDLLHLNSARYLDAEQAALLPGAAAGDLLISLRNLDVIAVLDMSVPTIKWAMRGPWHMQHDPHILPNGKLLVFDNRGDLTRSGASRVIEVDPVSMAVSWRYPTAADDPLYTVICGSAERLANGNTLIAETNNGRLLEVTPAGDPVWDYSIPERYTTDDGVTLSKAWHVQRIDPADLPFLLPDKTL